MFTGTISYEGEEAPPQHTLDMATQCALQLRAQKQAWAAPRMTKSFDLADGSQAYVLDLDHVWRIHIVPPTEGYEEDDYEVSVPTFPLQLSATIAGVLSGGMNIITLDYYEDLEPTGPYIRNHNFNLMPESAALFPTYDASAKLAVQENDAFAPFRGDTPLIFSQFATIEPGNYTGAMSHVIQLLLGVGNILEYDYEQRWLDADPNRAPLMAKEVDLDPITGELEQDDVFPPTSFYTGQGNTRVQVAYDWRWNRTHGIMWGRDNQQRRQPMLVELGQRGVHVMPFPVDELSKREDVQEHYLKVYPDLGRFAPFEGGQRTLFEALGGFPTGERMPGVVTDFNRWVRAGYLWAGNRDLSEFYSGMFMSTGFGWSFHPSGPRAINTMWKFNSRGQKVGYCYEVTLDIQEKPDSQKVRNTVTGQVIAALGLTDPIDRFKAARLPQSVAEGFVSSPDYEAFDAFEVEPDWAVSVTLFRLREGIIEYPGFQCTKGPAGPCGHIQSAPHFKYYEPAIGAVLNFDFEKSKGVPDPDRSDGPIFAAYVNGSAEILCYSHDYTAAQSISINTRQICQYSGGWQIKNYSEGNRLVGQFYTSSRDFRQKINTGGGSIRNVQGEIVGDYDFLSFCAFFARDGIVTKRWVGSETWQQRAWSNRSYSVSVSCASNNRSMFFVCHETVDKDVQNTEGFSGALYIGDSGTILWASIYNFIFHWTGVCRGTDHKYPPHGTPPCVMTFSSPDTVNPFACMGTDAPAEFVYSVCCVNDGVIGGCYANSELIIRSPADNAVIQSAAVTRSPTLPPSYSTSAPTVRDYEYEVWAFGHPLLHNRRIRRRQETVTDHSLWTPSLSNTEWWRCSIPGECPAYPWRVVANYYGPPYVGTNEELGGFGWVEYGLKPQVGGRFFGVVY